MHNKNYLLSTGKWPGFFISCTVGVLVFFLGSIVNSSLYDSLVISLLFGMIVRAFIGNNENLIKGFFLAPTFFIPIGAVLYGAINLNFLKFQGIDPRAILLLFFVVSSYFISILVMGKLVQQKKQITYLVAIGSGICGASAIAVNAPAVDADADDISISLISVFVTALFGLFIFFPFLKGLFSLTDTMFVLLSGMTLQFTGFVKAAVTDFSKDLAGLALSIKALRYLILLVTIPVFASLTKKRVYIPWFLWAFLLAGLVFSFFPTLTSSFTPTLKILLDIFWSIAMAGVGLSANAEAMFSDNGLKAISMAFTGFIVATTIFLIGISVFF